MQWVWKCTNCNVLVRNLNWDWNCQFFPRGLWLPLWKCVFFIKNCFFDLPTVVFVSQLEKVCTSKGDDVQSDLLTSYQLWEPAYCESYKKVKVELLFVKKTLSTFPAFLRKCDQICNLYKHLEENPLKTFSSIIDWTSIVCQKKRKGFS